MRLGIDLGGTKMEAAIIGDDGATLWRERTATPADDYAAIIGGINHLIAQAKHATGFDGNVGMGIPGSINPHNGRVWGANSQTLNHQNLKADCEAASGRRFRLDNDANCFALSEAIDGAGAGFDTVFGVILGTGCGGGLVANGKILRGGNNSAGEWGHTPLPWAVAGEYDGHQCWCGKHGCLETYISGTAVAAEYEVLSGARLSGVRLTAEEIAGRVAIDLVAASVLQAFEDRLARALSQIITIIDPDAIVVGGGLSNIARIYDTVPSKFDAYCFAPKPITTPLLPPKHGDSSGVRGAAWLWPDG